GQHHDRNLRPGSDPAADLEAVDSGQPDVEYDAPHRLAPQFGECLLPGPAPDDMPAVLLLEVLLDKPSDRVVVLHEQEGATRCLHAHGLRIGAAPALPMIRTPCCSGFGGCARRRRTAQRRPAATTRPRASGARARSAGAAVPGG